MDALMWIKPLLGGMRSYIPALGSTGQTGGSISARYCYSVWLRHLKLIREARPSHPLNAVIELGPGDSIGVGLASLLTGVEQYTALDVVRYANPGTNVRILDELLELFSKRVPVPGDDEFPGVFPRLGDYSFPSHLLPDSAMAAALEPSRVARIRRAATAEEPEGPIRYVCPWTDRSFAEPGTVDLILSQVVLQDIEDLARAYEIMTTWLKPRGLMSHQIDLSFPYSRAVWNRHWGYPDLVWTIVRGKRPYYYNRVAYSRYVQLTKMGGHSVLKLIPVRVARQSIRRTRVAAPFRTLPEEDFQIAAAYILSEKSQPAS